MDTFTWYLSVVSFLSFGYVFGMMTLPSKADMDAKSAVITKLSVKLKEEKSRIKKYEEQVRRLEDKIEILKKQSNNNQSDNDDYDFSDYF